MKNITAVIVAKNQPPFLFKVIDSISDLVTETIIIDIGISKALFEKLKKYPKLKVISLNEPVPYVELIREKTKDFVNTDYIFFLDPDEIVPPKLKSIIKLKFDQYDFLRIPRKNIIFGRWIKHSRWWPDYQIRIFKKNKIVWPKIIHRQPKTSGIGFEIEAKEENALIHHNYQDIDEYLEKARRYAKYEAKEFYEEKRIFTFSDAVKKSINEFISRYFAAEGYKDGVQGFILAVFQMFYYFLVYFYYLEMKKFKFDEKIDESEFFRIGLKEVLHWKKRKSLMDRIIKKIL